MNNISDESVIDIGRRRFYIQNYEFTMLAFLLDEEEFEVAPAVSRIFNTYEVVQSRSRGKKKSYPENPDSFETAMLYPAGTNTKSIMVDYTGDFVVDQTENITSWDVYINGDFYGSDVSVIQVNTNETLRVDIVQTDVTQPSKIIYGVKLV
jgi:hypothetical protein